MVSKTEPTFPTGGQREGHARQVALRMDLEHEPQADESMKSSVRRSTTTTSHSRFRLRPDQTQRSILLPKRSNGDRPPAPGRCTNPIADAPLRRCHLQSLNPRLDPSLREAVPARTRKAPLYRACLSSGRQDLNLRPPGPQPDQSGSVRLDSALYVSMRCAALSPVALSLDPELDPHQVGGNRQQTLRDHSP